MLRRTDCTQFSLRTTRGRKLYLAGFFLILGGQGLTPGAVAQDLPSPPSPRDHVSHAQQSTSLLLKCIIYSLRDILNIDLMVGAGQGEDEWLDPDAASLSTEYALYGLSSALTSQQVTDGLGDCDEALSLIENSASELDISEEACLSLHETIQEMRSELLDVH